MIKVKLISSSNTKPLELASHAAMSCYQAEVPQWGKVLNVKERLFNVGHHTTLEHTCFTFNIEGIAVGDITFGMHLASPFYNSDQRSGRYCAKMFLEPNFKETEEYIKNYWPKVTAEQRKKILEYIKKGVEIYHKNIEKAAEISKQFISEERPFIPEEALVMNAPKIAQEQMRMFIPVIFPTGFDFSIDLVTLVSMNRADWSPSMQFVIKEMVREVLKEFPEIDFMFENGKGKEWFLNLPSKNSIKVKLKPALKLLGIEGIEDFIFPNSELLHPVDLLHFTPQMMNNNTGTIRTEVEISVATMGQDQRHRTIGRSEPKFTGNFYLPPILKKMKMEKDAIALMKQWISVSKDIPKTLAMVLAPYGAMVKYKKRGSFNAVAHEQGKRLCWCAQEEIYHLGRALRMAIQKKGAKYKKLLKIFEPPCYETGRCAEGVRYCGRDMKLRKKGDYFPERKI